MPSDKFGEDYAKLKYTKDYSVVCSGPMLPIITTENGELVITKHATDRMLDHLSKTRPDVERKTVVTSLSKILLGGKYFVNDKAFDEVRFEGSVPGSTYFDFHLFGYDWHAVVVPENECIKIFTIYPPARES